MQLRQMSKVDALVYCIGTIRVTPLVWSTFQFVVFGEIELGLGLGIMCEYCL